jgi:hypothetical protein
MLYVSVFEDGTATVSKNPPPNNWVNTVGVPASQNSEEIQADLSLSSLPLLDEEVSLVFTVTPSIDLPDARVSIVLPEKGMEVVEIKPPSRPTVPSEFTVPAGLNVLGKQFSWRGDIARGETIRIELVVKSTEIGEGYVYGSVDATRPDGVLMVKTVQLDITVTQHNTATVRKSYPSVRESEGGNATYRGTGRGITPGMAIPTGGNNTT